MARFVGKATGGSDLDPPVSASIQKRVIFVHSALRPPLRRRPAAALRWRPAAAPRPPCRRAAAASLRPPCGRRAAAASLRPPCGRPAAATCGRPAAGWPPCGGGQRRRAQRPPWPRTRCKSENIYLAVLPCSLGQARPSQRSANGESGASLHNSAEILWLSFLIAQYR